VIKDVNEWLKKKSHDFSTSKEELFLLVMNKPKRKQSDLAST
jgi:hypothetical protein